MLDRAKARPTMAGGKPLRIPPLHPGPAHHPRENQTKQVALLSASPVPVRKEYLLQGQTYYYSGSHGDLGEKQKVGVFVEFDNYRNPAAWALPKGARN